MKFVFSVNLIANELEKGDKYFYNLTNFPKDIPLPIYRIFPMGSFVSYLLNKFGENVESFRFYTYLNNSLQQRIRISGFASLTTKGYKFVCETEGIPEATIVEAEKHTSIARLINTAASEFLRNPDWEKVLENTFRMFGKNLGFSRICLYKNHTRSNYAYLLLEWTKSGKEAILPKGKETIPFDENGLERWHRNLAEGKAIFENFDELLGTEKQILIHHKAKSLMALPVFTETLFWGFLLFETKTPKPYSSDEISILESFASILGIAIKSRASLKKLVETEKKLSLITQTTSAVLYSKKFGKKRYEYISESILNLTGYTKEELEKIGFKNLVLDVSKERFHAFNGSSLKSNDEGTETDYLIRTKDGKEKWISDQRFEWRNEQGKLIGETGILRDISKRKKFEFELEKTNKILNSVVNFAEALLNELNLERNISLMIESLAHATNVSRISIYAKAEKSNELVLKSEWVRQNIMPLSKFEDMVKIPLAEGTYSALETVKNQKAPFYFTLSSLAKKEQKKLAKTKIKSFLLIPIFIRNNFHGIIEFDDCEKEREWSEAEVEALNIAAKLIGASIKMQNFITELKTAKEEAQKSDKFKSEFINLVSHEIRTPLNNILSFSGLLEEEIIKKGIGDYDLFFQGIKHGQKRLKRTIDSFIRAAELQANAYKPSPTIINLNKDIFAPLKNLYESEAIKKNINFKISPCSLDEDITTDKEAFLEILEHLIDNAIKYTVKGEVIIRCRKEKEYLTIEVKDTGIGIAKKYQPNIFNLFTQESSGYTRRFDGNGLGLFIAKGYADILGIELFFESKKNIGTTFFIKFPLS